MVALCGDKSNASRYDSLRLFNDRPCGVYDMIRRNNGYKSPL